MIKGTSSNKEYNWLYQTAKNFNKGGMIVEIGASKGAGTISLARGLKDRREREE